MAPTGYCAIRTHIGDSFFLNPLPRVCSGIRPVLEVLAAFADTLSPSRCDIAIASVGIQEILLVPVTLLRRDEFLTPNAHSKRGSVPAFTEPFEKPNDLARIDAVSEVVVDFLSVCYPLIKVIFGGIIFRSVIFEKNIANYVFFSVFELFGVCQELWITAESTSESLASQGKTDSVCSGENWLLDDR